LWGVSFVVFNCFSASEIWSYKKGGLGWQVPYKRNLLHLYTTIYSMGCRGRDRMVVGFTTTYAISAYHH
jgi:hypothetical protein